MLDLGPSGPTFHEIINYETWTILSLLQFSWRRGSKDSRVCFLKILSTLCIFLAFHSNPWILGPLNPSKLQFTTT